MELVPLVELIVVLLAQVSANLGVVVNQLASLTLNFREVGGIHEVVFLVFVQKFCHLDAREIERSNDLRSFEVLSVAWFLFACLLVGDVCSFVNVVFLVPKHLLVEQLCYFLAD